MNDLHKQPMVTGTKITTANNTSTGQGHEKSTHSNTHAPPPLPPHTHTTDAVIETKHTITITTIMRHILETP